MEPDVPVAVANLTVTAETSPVETAPPATEVDRATAGMGGLGYIGDGGIPVWEDGAIRQEWTAVDFSWVHVRDRRWDAQLEQWSDEVVHSTKAPFFLCDVASAGLDVLCVAGFETNGDFVLERWELVPATQASRSELGATPLQFTASGILLSKDFRRTRIHKGPLGTAIHGMEFDPEARFMLVLLETGATRTLYRFENRRGAVPTALCDSNAIPELNLVSDIYRGTHKASGIRAWTLRSIENPDLVMFLDTANDGTFDGPPLVGTDSSMSDLGLGLTWGDWDSHNGTGN